MGSLEPEDAAGELAPPIPALLASPAGEAAELGFVGAGEAAGAPVPPIPALLASPAPEGVLEGEAAELVFVED